MLIPVKSETIPTPTSKTGLRGNPVFEATNNVKKLSSPNAMRPKDSR